MPLQVLPADAADAPRAAAIERDAYAPNPFGRFLFPGPPPADAVARRSTELVEQRDADPTTRWFKVVDTDADPAGDEATVAFARFHVYDAPREPGPAPARRMGEWCNAEACEAVFGGISRMHEKVVGGRRCIYLKLLHTDPKHQRRGAAGLLVQSVLDEANRLGLPAAVESTEEGHKLYQKYGFRDVDILEVDMSKWGASDKYRSWAMIREPQPAAE